MVHIDTITGKLVRAEEGNALPTACLAIAGGLTALLLMVCMTGCEPGGMVSHGSSSLHSALWDEPVPDGGGAIHVTTDSDSSGWATYQFDAEGRLAESETYTSEGATWSLKRYSYDDQGRISSITGSGEGGGPDTAENFERRYRYEEREDGGFDVEVRDGSGALTGTASYDAGGRVLESSGTDSRTVYEYDGQSRVTSERRYDIRNGSEAIDWYNERHYEYGTDERGDYRRTYFFDPDTHQADTCYTYRLDSEGNTIEVVETELQNDGTWMPTDYHRIYTYDEPVEHHPGTDAVSSMTEVCTSRDPQFSYSSTTAYDETGNPLSYTYTTANATSTSTAEYRGSTPAGFLDDRLFSTFKTP